MSKGKETLASPPPKARDPHHELWPHNALHAPKMRRYYNATDFLFDLLVVIKVVQSKRGRFKERSYRY